MIKNNNFFLELEKILENKNITNKIESFSKLQNKFKNNEYTYESINTKVFQHPSYIDELTVVPSYEIKNRKNLHEKSGIAFLLHTVAHIEYSAIDLALDACYRFQDLPHEYYTDWIDVAADEVRHFELICTLMKKYDISYGDLPVHSGLFDASMKSLELIPRMALIPRHMEANGLDSNAFIISKLMKIKNTQEVIELFELILEEEIDHVLKGDKWYKYACSKKENFTCNYFDIIEKIHPNSFKRNKTLNVEARKRAGFSSEEIAIMQSK
ncbi:MAG TPA: ferritin-like domain-containing protein [Arcobacter sp.]|nr:ferritin-like domain-containing protein [Arcobacter sp.]HIP55559.1 ferritin-like domain-containing protein [Arcobacter sp.]